MSLDRGDNDPVSFWSYLIAAVHTVVPGVGANELALLASPQPPPVDTVLATVLNDVAAAGEDVVLVLDDYHVIDAREVHEGMAFLLDHLPPGLHLVIARRADPVLPLARLRARGELVEVRAADLRFTPDEVAAYLNGVMGLQLTAHDVSALEERTEGWIAALQLAALSMQGRDDVTGFIAGFTGDDRYIVDYLAEEVLQRQPGRCATSCCRPRSSADSPAPLCDAVTGTAGGKAMLERLDRGNLFVVPLDDRRQWYRYHHLFADVLRARLIEESPDLVPALHRRASDWYSENGDRFEAIDHAMAGGHVERAADLVELALPALGRDRQEEQLRSWLEQLPEEVLGEHPVLSNGYAGALLSTGHFEDVERHLRNAERWLDEDAGARTEPTSMVVVNDEEFRRLPASVAIHRAGLSLVTGDPAATVAHARRALDLLEEDHDLGRAAAAALTGLARWSTGDLEAAREAYASCLGSMERAGHLADVLGLCIALTDILITQGRLREAMRTYEQALGARVAARRPGAARHGRHVRRDEHAPPRTQRPALRPGSSSRRARRSASTSPCRRTAIAGGWRWPGSGWSRGLSTRPSTSSTTRSAATSATSRPTCDPVPAVRARVWIAQGRLDDASRWARDRGLTADDELTYLREYEHVTLARALVREARTAAPRRRDRTARPSPATPPKPATARAASSRSSCCRPSRRSCAAISPLRWWLWNAR